MLIFVCMTNILLITSLISLLSNSLTKVTWLPPTRCLIFTCLYDASATFCLANQDLHKANSSFFPAIILITTVYMNLTFDVTQVLDHAREEYLFQ